MKTGAQRPAARFVRFILQLFLLAPLAGLQPPAPCDPPPLPPGYRWIANPGLSDEFNGMQLDSSKWLDYHSYWAGRPPSQFSKANVSVSSGCLQLGSTSRVSDLSEVADPDHDIWVDAACVSSRGPTAFYGYYETRMKASDLSMTSSYWIQGRFSEIDVVEQLGAPLSHPLKCNDMMMNTHYFAGGWSTDRKTPRTWGMPSCSGEKFHTYGVWWKDEKTTWFYHDDQKVAEVEPGGLFTEPMYMFFDTEVFTWEGLPSIASLSNPTSNTVQVDWVRSWKLEPASAQAKNWTLLDPDVGRTSP
ncbi:family 16 glycosylhydrolase [bacterium]|nr:family 16 glycosylhydrolase [bacterium]